MDEGDIARIPLRNRAGEVVAWAIVDAADAERIGQHRWFLHAFGAPARESRAGRRRAGSYVYLAREILGLEPGDPTSALPLNGDQLDCRRANLRAVTRPERGQRLRPRIGTSSKYRGVGWYARKNKWRAYGRVDGTMHWLGYFDDELMAAKVAADWRREHMPYALEPPDPRESRADQGGGRRATPPP